jgi:hypothetical protein
MAKPPQRDLDYCLLVLMLTLRIHGTESAMRNTARRCVKLLPKRQRELMQDIIQSRYPLELVRHIARNVD